MCKIYKRTVKIWNSKVENKTEKDMPKNANPSPPAKKKSPASMAILNFKEKKHF